MTDTIYDLRLHARHGHIECSDPMVVRADVLVVEHATRDRPAHVGAVVDGIMLELGVIDDALIKQFARDTYTTVHAPHFSGGEVSRKIPVIHH